MYGHNNRYCLQEVSRELYREHRGAEASSHALLTQLFQSRHVSIFSNEEQYFSGHFPRPSGIADLSEIDESSAMSARVTPPRN